MHWHHNLNFLTLIFTTLSLLSLQISSLSFSEHFVLPVDESHPVLHQNTLKPRLTDLFEPPRSKAAATEQTLFLQFVYHDSEYIPSCC